MKLDQLIDFVKEHALSDEDKKDERVISSKSQTSMNQQSDSTGYMLLTTVGDIEEKILADWKASLLYVAHKDALTHVSVIEELAQEYGSFINVGLLVVDDVNEVTADLKKEFKSSKLPQIRYYPNLKTDTEKRGASFEIVTPKAGDHDSVKEAIMEELLSNFVSDVKDVSEQVYYSVGG